MKFYTDNQNVFRNQTEFKKDDYGYYYSVPTSSLPVIQGFTDLQENNPKEIDIRFETIYSMLIRQMMDNANRTADLSFSSTVFTILNNAMSIQDRKRLKVALKLANVKPTAFLIDNAASLIYYQAKNLPGDKEDSVNFLAIDIGQFSTKLTLIELGTKSNDPKDPKKGFY